MFRFIKEVEDNSRINEEKTIDSFGNIESFEEMTAEDAMFFWDEELSGKYQEYEENYSQYLTEIFNPSEDDFKYDIEISDEIKGAISLFDSEKWSQLTTGEKIDSINNIKELVSKELNLSSVPEIKYYDDEDGTYGYYSPYNDCININIEKTFLNDPKEMLNTVIHELRHAFQYERAEQLETKEDALFRCNLENYIDFYKSFYAYQNQYVEADARAYADAFIKSYEEETA